MGQCPQKACAWSLIRSSMTNAGISSGPITTRSERSHKARKDNGGRARMSPRGRPGVGTTSYRFPLKGDCFLGPPRLRPFGSSATSAIWKAKDIIGGESAENRPPSPIRHPGAIWGPEQGILAGEAAPASRQRARHPMKLSAACFVPGRSVRSVLEGNFSPSPSFVRRVSGSRASDPIQAGVLLNGDNG
jgi:hypothetical protein